MKLRKKPEDTGKHRIKLRKKPGETGKTPLRILLRFLIFKVKSGKNQGKWEKTWGNPGKIGKMGKNVKNRFPSLHGKYNESSAAKSK